MKKKLTKKEEKPTIRLNRKPPPEKIWRGEIFQIACRIKDGEADPKDAKRLMESFCDYVNKEVQGRKQVLGCPPDKQIPKELLWHFRDVFKAILKGKKSPESALGLKRRPGALPETELHIAIATKYLKLAIRGIPDTAIKIELHSKFNRSKTAIGDAWKKYKVQALWRLRDEREKNSPLRLLRPESLWRSKELELLEKLFRCKPKDRKQLEEERNHTRYRQNPTRAPSHH